MAKGKAVDNGSTRVAPNGYHYTKVNGTWRLTHHIKMEEYIGRKLRDGERVHFVTGNKLDFSKKNLRLVVQGTTTARKKVAQLEAKLQDVQADLAFWRKRLEDEERDRRYPQS